MFGFESTLGFSNPGMLCLLILLALLLFRENPISSYEKIELFFKHVENLRVDIDEAAFFRPPLANL